MPKSNVWWRSGTRFSDIPVYAAVAVALGYLVDTYDIMIFSAVRTRSLADLHVAPTDMLTVGATLLNVQLFGMVLGGFFWGAMGDRVGRVKLLFASILTYSLANIANAFVGDIPQYALARFFAGFGLAGELGLGITLLGEITPVAGRGLVSVFVVASGVLGALGAGLVGNSDIHWRNAYLLGGVAGLVLLGFRVGMNESSIYRQAEDAVGRGSLLYLISQRSRVSRLLLCVAIGMPIWFVIGVLITFLPELAGHCSTPVTTVPAAMSAFFLGSIPGDIVCGVIGQRQRSRKGPIVIFIVLLVGLVVIALSMVHACSGFLFWVFPLLGFACGYWPLLTTFAAEQFGTNLRATAAVSVPNLVRASAIFMTYGIALLVWISGAGILIVTGGVGLAVFVVSLWSAAQAPETFHRSLDYRD